MTRPRLLDLFCGAGGAAMGYHRAGFDVVGVDNRPQPHYPFEFHQGDALVALDELTRGMPKGLLGVPFDAVHASPPCQRYSAAAEIHDSSEQHPDLIEPTRHLLQAIGRPYVIENVERSPLSTSLMLCGSMFDLGVRRHRWFESNQLDARPPMRLPPALVLQRVRRPHRRQTACHPRRPRTAYPDMGQIRRRARRRQPSHGYRLDDH